MPDREKLIGVVDSKLRSFPAMTPVPTMAVGVVDAILAALSEVRSVVTDDTVERDRRMAAMLRAETAETNLGIARRMVEERERDKDILRQQREEQRERARRAERERDEARKEVERVRKAIQRHLDTFGYDNHEGLADALAALNPEGGKYPPDYDGGMGAPDGF